MNWYIQSGLKSALNLAKYCHPKVENLHFIQWLLLKYWQHGWQTLMHRKFQTESELQLWYLQSFLFIFRTTRDQLNISLGILLHNGAESSSKASSNITTKNFQWFYHKHYISISFLSRELVIIVDAPEAVDVELYITYVVIKAGWSPKYDIRVFSNDGTMKVRLFCRLSGKLWYLQHNCVGDTVVYH